MRGGDLDIENVAFLFANRVPVHSPHGLECRDILLEGHLYQGPFVSMRSEMSSDDRFLINPVNKSS